MSDQSSDVFVDDFERQSVARAMGLDKFSDVKKNQHQIERLIEWARAKGAKDTTDVVWNIKQLANRIGSPKLGNNWPQHLSQYAFLEMERMKLDGQLREMEPSVEAKKNGTDEKTDTA